MAAAAAPTVNAFALTLCYRGCVGFTHVCHHVVSILPSGAAGILGHLHSCMRVKDTDPRHYAIVFNSMCCPSASQHLSQAQHAHTRCWSVSSACVVRLVYCTRRLYVCVSAHAVSLSGIP